MSKKSKLSELLTSWPSDQNTKTSELNEKTPFKEINSDSETLKTTCNLLVQTEKGKYEDMLETAVNDFTEDLKHESTIKSQKLLKNYFSNYQETSFEFVDPKPLNRMQPTYEKLPSECDFNMINFSLVNTENTVKTLLKQASFDVEILSNSPVHTECNCTFFEECGNCDLFKFQLPPTPKDNSNFDFQEQEKVKEVIQDGNSNINKIPLRKRKSYLSNAKQQQTSLKQFFGVIKTQSGNGNRISEKFDQSKTFFDKGSEIKQNKNLEDNKLVPISKNINPVKKSTETFSHFDNEYSDDFVFPIYSNIENDIVEDKFNSSPQDIFLSQDNKTTLFNVQSNTICKTIPLDEKDHIFQQGLKKITENENLIYNPLYDNIPQNINKKFILNQIEKLFSKILSDFVNKDAGPSFRIRTFKWNNCTFINDRLKLNKREDSRYLIVRYQSLPSQAKFNILVYILGKCYSLVKTNCFCTKREIYYQIVNYVDCQEKINDAVNSVSCLLDVPPWELGVLASSKGLVFGNLEITLTSGDRINFSNKGGTLIPQNPTEISSIKTDASCILVIEKDSIYQKLLDENCLTNNKFLSSFILITGKGYPDTNTRLFLKILWMKSFKPAFILADADPHGIDIMLTYRFGSLNSSHLSNYLALPNLRWLGILPSEIISLDIKGQPLTTRDQNQIKSLLDRPYFQAGANQKIKREIAKLQEKKTKAEIEGIMKTDNFLSDVYLPNKFFTQNYI